MAETFAKAFAAARKKLGAGKTFTWNGKSYSTNRADDKADKPKPKPRPAAAAPKPAAAPAKPATKPKPRPATAAPAPKPAPKNAPPGSKANLTAAQKAEIAANRERQRRIAAAKARG